MDNIKFLGYCADGTFRTACKQRENPLSLESFYRAVNQDTDSGRCSCCKREVIVYAVQQWSLQLNHFTLSLCVDCARKLPLELEVMNLNSNGAPPLLTYKINASEV